MNNEFGSLRNPIISRWVVKNLVKGEMAEWSKAPALGAGPQGRGFEPHFHHIFLFWIA